MYGNRLQDKAIIVIGSGSGTSGWESSMITVQWQCGWRWRPVRVHRSSARPSTRYATRRSRTVPWWPAPVRPRGSCTIRLTPTVRRRWSPMPLPEPAASGPAGRPGAFRSTRCFRTMVHRGASPAPWPRRTDRRSGSVYRAQVRTREGWLSATPAVHACLRSVACSAGWFDT